MFEFIKKYFVGYIQDGLNDLKSVVINLGDDAIRHEESQNQKIINLGRRINNLNNKIKEAFKENGKYISKIDSNAKEIEILKKALIKQEEVVIKK